MSYNLSEDGNFLELDGMTFIAIPSDIQDHRTIKACHGCYFLSTENGCNWNQHTLEYLKCITLNDDRLIIWLRTT